jgi:hypothetical protein
MVLLTPIMLFIKWLNKNVFLVFRKLALLSPLSSALPRQIIRVFNNKPSPTEIWRPNFNPKSRVYIIVYPEEMQY